MEQRHSKLPVVRTKKRWHAPNPFAPWASGFPGWDDPRATFELASGLRVVISADSPNDETHVTIHFRPDSLEEQSAALDAARSIASRFSKQAGPCFRVMLVPDTEKYELKIKRYPSIEARAVAGIAQTMGRQR